MYLATLETRHFRFQAFGETSAKAVETLRLGWEEHRRLTGADPWDEYADGVGLLEFETDQCFRDGFLLLSQGIPCRDAAEAEDAAQRLRARVYELEYPKAGRNLLPAAARRAKPKRSR